jgi:hypothetical protein
MARGLGDQVEHDQAEVALIEDPAATTAAAMMLAATQTATMAAAPAAFVPESIACPITSLAPFVIVHGIPVSAFEHELSSPLFTI